MNSEVPLVSVIIPIRNGESWIDECFLYIERQTATKLFNIEVSVYNDASSDKTVELLHKWKDRLETSNIKLKIAHNSGFEAKGVGYAKNRAVEASAGTYLCFQDIDDMMMPDRILSQYSASRQHPNAIIGSNFSRTPQDSTLRFTKWANSLTTEQLYTQIYTSHGPTLIMPTWFCTRAVFDRVGGFSEAGKGDPEDLVFFYSHLDKGGDLVKVEECLVVYRYHPNATSFTIDERTIWNIRIKRLQEKCLKHWDKFVIWNAGKQGRRFYKSLDTNFQGKVTAFCDVDVNKIGKNYEPYDRECRHTKSRQVPIVHFSKAEPPFIICVKLDLTDGNFEENLSSLNLTEGKDYILFS